MRQLADTDRIRRFMHALGEQAEQETRLYFTGGATAVLLGWRESTIDVDVHFEPETDPVFQALPGLKEKLEINVELVSPVDFIPELSAWQERSVHITREGKVTFYHYDLYAQALAKIERSHAQDVDDVQEMIRRNFVEPAKLWGFFDSIEPRLYRYPAIDPASFRRAVEDLVGPHSSA